jgi:hypothetical protein
MISRYKTSPLYGRMRQKEEAVRSGGNYAVQQQRPSFEDAFIGQEEQRKITLKGLGMQQKNFDRSLKESGRQFDIKMGIANEQFRWRRKQNRKAEFLGLFNVALGVGGGLMEHMEKSKYRRSQQHIMDLYEQYLTSMTPASGASGPGMLDFED